MCKTKNDSFIVNVVAICCTVERWTNYLSSNRVFNYIRNSTVENWLISRRWVSRYEKKRRREERNSYQERIYCAMIPNQDLLKMKRGDTYAHIHEQTIQQHRRRIYATARIEGSRLPLKVFVYVPDPLYPTLNWTVLDGRNGSR